MAKLTWENIDNFHERAKVFGGWLVKAYTHIETRIMKKGPVIG